MVVVEVAGRVWSEVSGEGVDLVVFDVSVEVVGVDVVVCCSLIWARSRFHPSDAVIVDCCSDSPSEI